MKNKQFLALKITFSIFIYFLLFFLVFIFIFSDSISLKEFYFKLFEQKLIFGKSVFYFYLYFGISFLVIFLGIYLISNYFVIKYFLYIENYNKKLKDYNHYLAHELKTPISIISSNLDVLKYGYNENKIINSKKELNNIIKIIDGLLKFSETIQISNKKDINLENFINNYIYFLNNNQNIKINNKEFNFIIHTDEVLFLRIIKNLIENALKYSLDKKLNIYIKNNSLIFENNIFTTLEQEEIDKLYTKFYSKSYNNDNNGNGIGLCMIKEIVKTLGYKLKISSKNDKFTVKIDFDKN